MAKLQFPFSKDPTSDLDYICDWSEWLGADTIESSTWQVPPELNNTGDDFNTSVTTIWLGAGVAGNTYTLTNTIVTVGGRTVERDIKLKVQER